MAAPLLLRSLPLLHRRLIQPYLRLWHINGSIISLRTFCNPAVSTTDSTGSDGNKRPSLTQLFLTKSVKNPLHYPGCDDPNFQKWKVKEAEILGDIEPTICLVKEILHSNRYMDGELLSPDDEKVVVDKLLTHHPHYEDKIGCGLHSIMVGLHPHFSHTRCLFVVRTDGEQIDFSYQKCLRAYIGDKYPSYANRFIKLHFKRGSG
ncbi:Protein of unknown function (DUF3223 [Striga hermonthica]|uniref:DCL protein n=1 Tax=Striga hermonthica TaxID=68872 RepID=A0A9N7NYD9_STRHE|nr:Protein of unknown function (DUF3223 [Striga hermonthica]